MSEQKQRARLEEKLVQCLVYEKFEKHDVVFKYGEVGNKFYIILDGEVGVLIPKNKEEMAQLNQNEEEDIVTDNDEIRLLEKIERKGHTCFSGQIPIYDLKRKLGSLKSFGNIALTYCKLRTATIACMKDTHLLSLDKRSYLEILESDADDTGKLLRFLGRCFPGLDRISLANIMCHLEEEVLKMNSVLYTRGSNAKYCYIVKSGSVRVSRMPQRKKPERMSVAEFDEKLGETPNQKRLYPVDVCLLGEGTVMGFKEILQNVTYQDTAHVNQNYTKVLKINDRVYCRVILGF